MSFSTIRFYIILKPALTPYDMEKRFSTIRFYIILKLPFGYGRHKSGFSTIRFYIILKLIPFCDALFFSFQYHTFLHHSQTDFQSWRVLLWFQYHTFLHHSQTHLIMLLWFMAFQYHTFLHHSQTLLSFVIKLPSNKLFQNPPCFFCISELIG